MYGSASEFVDLMSLNSMEVRDGVAKSKLSPGRGIKGSRVLPESITALDHKANFILAIEHMVLQNILS